MIWRRPRAVLPVVTDSRQVGMEQWTGMAVDSSARRSESLYISHTLQTFPGG